MDWSTDASLTSEGAVEGILAGWRRMDMSAVAAVLQSTTWSYLTGDQVPATAAAEPMSDWEASEERDEPEGVEARAARVAWDVLNHDPRFADQLRLLWGPAFSEDFQEFVHLLVETAAHAAALYATRLDGHGELPAARAARATAALMDIELLPDGPRRHPTGALPRVPPDAPRGRGSSPDPRLREAS